MDCISKELFLFSIIYAYIDNILGNNPTTHILIKTIITTTTIIMKIKRLSTAQPQDHHNMRVKCVYSQTPPTFCGLFCCKELCFFSCFEMLNVQGKTTTTKNNKADVVLTKKKYYKKRKNKTSFHFFLRLFVFFFLFSW